MKTIKERALEYTRPIRMCGELSKADATYNGFITGAISEHAELTKWHDPKEKLPSIGVPVLLKVKGDGAFPYIVNIRTIHPILGEGWGDGCGGILDEQFTKVLGWRKINE